MDDVDNLSRGDGVTIESADRAQLLRWAAQCREIMQVEGTDAGNSAWELLLTRIELELDRRQLEAIDGEAANEPTSDH